jgi:pimeloyl-ACP methyl ester carboxylesterase
MKVDVQDPAAARRGSRWERAGAWAGRIVSAVVVVEGAALLVLVALDGALSWRLFRAGVVIGVVSVFVVVPPRRVAAWIGLGVFGLVGVVAGMGIGLDHYLEVGLARTSLAGLAALASGGFLVAVATACLVWRLPGWWRLPAGLAALAFLRLVVLRVLIAPLALALALTNVPPTPLERVSPADLGLVYEDVSFPAEDGVLLSGWYLPSTSGAAVVLLHGAGSNRAAVLEHAAVLAHHGYGVLLFDARGHGRSEGHAMDFGWDGDLDIGGAMSYLATRPDVEPTRLGAVGLSLGGEMAIGAAARDPRIRAVVAEGATYRVAGDWSPYHAGGLVQRAMDWIFFTAADILSDADPPIELRDAVSQMAPRKLLLIESDEGMEAAAGRAYRDASALNVELWVVHGAGHIAGLETDPQAWEQRVVDFLDRELLQRAHAR